MKIIIDKYVPFLEGAFEGLAQVEVLAPADINAEAVGQADAMIVRTRTHCDEALLGHSPVRFIGTATIGMDHFDRTWLEKAGIEAVNAPGCNAPAVAQHVLVSLLTLRKNGLWGPSTDGVDPEQWLRGLTLGIVGCGHVGSVVERWARALGMRTLVCDPPRAEKEGPEGFCSLGEIARQADAVTFHTPLTKTGPHPSFHLLGREFLGKVARKPVIVNAARGAVADTEALIEAVDAGRVGPCVIDTWEGEPHISQELLGRAAIATPHIAGYSLEGKKRASQMTANALMDHFGFPADRRLDLGVRLRVPQGHTARQLLASYDVMADDALLRANPQALERLRDTYPLRHETEYSPQAQ